MLGNLRSPRKSLSRQRSVSRRFCVEPLEDRRVLSVTLGSAFMLEHIENDYDSHYDSYGLKLELDPAGNRVVIGQSRGKLDLDPGPEIVEFSGSAGGRRFIAKYTPNDELLWAQPLGARDAERGPDLAVGSDGAIYVTGGFSGSQTFGDTTLITTEVISPFLAKLDADGSYLWAKELPGGFGNSVAVDFQGNVVVAGNYPHPYTDAFISKYDADGNQIWNNVFGKSTAPPASTKKGPPQTNDNISVRVQAIAVDAAGTIYATGQMKDTVDFDPGPGVVTATGRAFLLKLDTDGNVNWAKGFTGGGLFLTPYDVGVDAAGNVYSTGSFTGTVTFDYITQPSSGKKPPKQTAVTLSNPSSLFADTYVIKWDSAGQLIWAKDTNGPGDEIPSALALDDVGNVYVTGGMSGVADFDPGPGTFNLASNGDMDAFVWKLDTDGNFGWVVGIGGSKGDSARGIAVDTGGNISVTGIFRGVVDFDPATDQEYLLTSVDWYSLFLMQLEQPASPLAMMAFALTVDGQAAPVAEGGNHARTSPTPSTAAKPPVVTLPAAAAHSPAAGVLVDRVLAQHSDELSWLDELWQEELESQGMAV